MNDGARRPLRGASTSDLTRPRALFVAVAAGALLAVTLLVARDGPHSLSAPGPVALPHRQLGCADCHERAQASSSCTGCHDNHDSRRPAHRELAAVGELVCGDCHAVHRSELGLRFEPGGQARLFGTGFDEAVWLAPVQGLAAPIVVPLVASAACARCHARGEPSDPAAHCLPAAEGQTVSVCFDEHRPPGARTVAASAERDGAVEAARALSSSVSQLARTRTLSAHATVLGAGLAFALTVAAALGRRAWSRPRRPLRAPAPGDGTLRRLPLIDTTRCLGCHACADACPYDVLEIRRYVAVVARPDACCGAGPCEVRCPNGSLVLAPVPAEASPPASPVAPARLRPGLYLAGDVAGGSLIRTAMVQGDGLARSLAEARSGRAKPNRHGALDLVVIGAGPAGLAAALTAKRLGLEVAVLEAGKIGESIRRFSRQKLVLDVEDADSELPLFLGNVAKDELVERWLYTVRAERLTVHEGVRALAFGPADVSGVTAVLATSEHGPCSFAGRSVLLAVGRRGAPRKLAAPIADEVLSRVHYELSDARAFAGKRVVVVGLGDVAMETALALAAQPGTQVTVVHRGDGFRRGKRRNIEAFGRLVARGSLELLLSTEVERVSRDGVTLSGRGQTLAFDALFVAVGSLSDQGLLAAAGVCAPSF